MFSSEENSLFRIQYMFIHGLILQEKLLFIHKIERKRFVLRQDTDGVLILFSIVC
jgi:hypothetical protein